MKVYYTALVIVTSIIASSISTYIVKDSFESDIVEYVTIYTATITAIASTIMITFILSLETKEEEVR